MIRARVHWNGIDLSERYSVVMHQLRRMPRGIAGTGGPFCSFTTSTIVLLNKVLPYQTVKILFASQTGTAQYLAGQLAQAVEEQVGVKAQVKSLNETQPQELQSKDLHLFVVSTTGLGEFPDNGKNFFHKIRSQHPSPDFPYAIFALGNASVYPNTFCGAGEALQATLLQSGHEPLLPLVKGDDGNSKFGVEDAFEDWQGNLIQKLTDSEPPIAEQREEMVPPLTAPEGFVSSTTGDAKAIVAAVPKQKSSRAPLDMRPPALFNPGSSDLLDSCPSFYQAHSRHRMKVISHKPLTCDPTITSLMHELIVELPPGITYETGDHFLVYPRNSDVVVRSYLKHAVKDKGIAINNLIMPSPQHAHYPHPTGISIYQTLSHAVDLEGSASRAFCKDYLQVANYNHDIVQQQRTLLELCCEHNIQLSLVDLLYYLPPLQPRVYSIASSAKVHPDKVYLTYRPVHYISKRGTLKQGLCTSYMQRSPISLVCGVQSNPIFRLPSDPETPIILIGGGCGVAPIRASLEELTHDYEKGLRPNRNVHLFLSFRHGADQVYTDLIQKAKSCILQTQQTVFASCRIGLSGTVSSSDLLSEALQKQSDSLREDLVHKQGHVYVCGGVGKFGTAIRQAVSDVVGKDAMSAMVTTGRYHEDLSD